MRDPISVKIMRRARSAIVVDETARMVDHDSPIICDLKSSHTYLIVRSCRQLDGPH